MWLAGLGLVLPDRTIEQGALEIHDGRISAIIEGDAVAARGEPVIRCDGLLALPGIIDMHGDMLESEAEPRPGVHFPLDLAVFELDKRLAANGVTTAYAAISFWETVRRERERSVDRAREMADAIVALRAELLVDLFVHARYEITTPSVAPAVVDLLEQGHVQLLSLMDHTPGQGQYRSLEQYIDVIARWRNVDRSLVEAEIHAKQGRAHEAEVWDIAGEIVALAIAGGVRVASHDDDSAGKVDLMAALGVTISEFPVTLEAAQEARRRGIAVAMGAPNILRGGSHSGNLSALDAIRAGAVDMLASDYSAAALLQAVFLVAREGLLPLHEAARLVSAGPADALGLTDRGRLASGLAADIVLVEPGTRPRVRATLRRGLPIYQDAALAKGRT
jgi:alpha-D-ribose 1-methylphosphonate 5-triphosphate diphosphatase